MPDCKDFVSVRKAEGRVHVQKRLVLSNLKETYQLFKEKYPDTKIGFSKFADVRPTHCVLAGVSGTHSVCVCTIHQNVKLMPKCYLNTCTSCPGISHLSECLQSLMDDNLVDNVVYKQWVSVDRCTLQICWWICRCSLWKAKSTSSSLIHCKAAICFPSKVKIRVASWRIASYSRLLRKLFLHTSRCSPRLPLE